MRSKIIAVPAALLVSLAMATGPALAEDDAEEVEVEKVEVEEQEGEDDGKAECTEGEESEGEEDGEEGGFEAAAVEAAEAAEDLEAGDECATGWDRAVQSFEATVARMEERAGEGEPKGAGYWVLQLLIAGESPSTIAGDQGKKMAEAAAVAREERENGKPDNAGRPDNAGQPENAGQPDNAGRPEHAGGGRPEGAGGGKP